MSERSGSSGTSPRRSPLPHTMLAEKYIVHYVGSAPLGSFDIRHLNMSGLQKPLYNIYLEYLKSGGGTQKRQREVLFTELGVRVLREEAGLTKEVFVDYGTLLFWDSIILRSFRSSGKKRYGMFESLRHDFRSMTEKPETLFPMDKKCPTLTMPAAPLVVFVNRPDPHKRELDCHALSFIAVEEAVGFVTALARRTKSFYEDYGTLSVDDVLFTPNDRTQTEFNRWKLTEDGWRLTSDQVSTKNEITKSQSEFIFENFPAKRDSSPSRRSGSSAERKFLKSPLNYNANWRKPIRGRSVSSSESKSPTALDPKSRSKSESTRNVSDPDEMYEYSPSSPHSSSSGSRSPRLRQASPPVDYDEEDSRLSPRVSPTPPKKLPLHMKTGVKVLPTLDPSSTEIKPSLNRSQSDIGYVSMRPDQAARGKHPEYSSEQNAYFESAHTSHQNKMKDKEIDSDLRKTVYLEGVDDDERSVSRTDFEQCLGYLP